ncbi:MAG: hypothetical protein AAB521_03060 [Patescibacteria group bacterium]
MSENGGGINQEPTVPATVAPTESQAHAETAEPAVAQTSMKQESKEGWVDRFKRLVTFSGSVVNEAQNAPQRLNPTSTAEPTPIEPQPQKT